MKHPVEMFREMYRVCKPGGVAIISHQNRCAYDKATAMWIKDMQDGEGHAKILANLFKFAPREGWRDITSVDITPDRFASNGGDPLWVVTAVKEASAERAPPVFKKTELAPPKPPTFNKT